MSKITDLQIQKNCKTRANVYLDGEFAFALEMLTVMKLGLKIGMEVSRETICEAVTDSECSVAFDRAINYLSRGGKTVRQMREYLAKRGYSADVTDYVVEKLLGYGYLDDEAYARAYAEQNRASKGSMRIKRELVQRGIPQALAESVSREDDETALQHAGLVAEKYMKDKTCDVKTLQRLQRRLLSRGYDYETVNSVLREYRQQD